MKWFRNLKISQKILLSFSLVIVIFIVSNIAAFFALKRMNTRVETLQREDIVVLNKVQRMNTKLEQIRKREYQIVSQWRSEDEIKKTMKKLAEDFEFLEKYVAEIQPLMDTDSTKTLVQRIQKGLATYHTLCDEIISLKKSGSIEAAAMQIELQNDDVKTAVQAEMTVLTQFYNERAKTHQKEAQADFRLSAIGLGVISLVSITSVIALAFLLGRAIARPIHRIQEAAEGVSSGNMNTAIRLEQTDEIGILSKAFDDMVEKIRDSLHRVEEKKIEVEHLAGEAEKRRLGAEKQREHLHTSVEKMSFVMRDLASGNLTALLLNDTDHDINSLYGEYNQTVDKLRLTVEQISHASVLASQTSSLLDDSSHQFAATAEEQAAQVTELTRAIQHVMFSSDSNTRLTHKAREISEENSIVAASGGEMLQQTLKRLRKMYQLSEASTERVQRLSESSVRISEILTTIEEIADQTNLLALNAAIEAARAGEQGRGFAVVADEVRKLAERTQKATKEISQMIGSIRQETQESVNMMQSQFDEIKNGVHLAEQAGTKLMSVIDGTKTIQNLVSNINDASHEETAILKEVITNAHSISAAAEEASQAVYSLANIATQLRRQSDELVSIGGQFRIQDAHIHSKTAPMLVLNNYASHQNH
jgi:methyl-accepting chemotaxis protein